MRNKADVNFVNEHGNTALHYACFGNYPAIAEDLVEFGALVNIENKYHETPLEKCQGNLAKRLHGNCCCHKLCNVRKTTIYAAPTNILIFHFL